MRSLQLKEKQQTSYLGNMLKRYTHLFLLVVLSIGLANPVAGGRGNEKGCGSFQVSGDVHYDIEEDVILDGARDVAGSRSGRIGGDVRVTTRLNTDQGTSQGNSQSVGVSVGLQALSAPQFSFGLGMSRGEYNKESLAAKSAFLGNANGLEIGGTAHSKGATLDPSLRDRFTSEAIHTHSYGSGFNLGGQIGIGTQGLSGGTGQFGIHRDLKAGLVRAAFDAKDDARVQTIFDSSAQLQGDTEALIALSRPVKQGKEIGGNVKATGKAVKHALDALNEDRKRQVGGRTVREAMNQSAKQAAGVLSLIRDKQLVAQLAQAPHMAPEDLAILLNQVAEHLKGKEGLGKKTPKIVFYQGDVDVLEGHASGFHHACYNEATDTIYINTNATDISDPKRLIQSVAVELQRARNAHQGSYQGMGAQNQQDIAYRMGRNAVEDFCSLGGNTPPVNPEAVAAWNRKYASQLRANAQTLAATPEDNLKPFVGTAIAVGMMAWSAYDIAKVCHKGYEIYETQGDEAALAYFAKEAALEVAVRIAMVGTGAVLGKVAGKVLKTPAMREFAKQIAKGAEKRLAKMPGAKAVKKVFKGNSKATDFELPVNKASKGDIKRLVRETGAAGKAGKWMTKKEGMSKAARAYQQRVTGAKPNSVFELNGVTFDGVRGNTLLDAKSGYLNFIDPAKGTFKPFFNKGKQSLIDQAKRQVKAAAGRPIEWHFEHKSVMEVVKKLFKKKEISGIKLVASP